MRERLYKFAIALSIILVADSLFMAWALYASRRDPYSMLGYGQVGLIPVFMPALLVSLVVVGFYVHGFTRRSWTARGPERAFFLILILAVVVKIIMVVRRWS